MSREPKKVLFYGKRDSGEYWPFSNFFPVKFYLDGKYWKSTEHYYQAKKTNNKCDQERICSAVTARAAKQMAQSVTLRGDWDKIKDDVMYRALKAKFSQCENCRRVLLKTKNWDIHEDSPTDVYWGWRNNGQDKLGKLLIKVRDELRAELVIM